MLKLTSTALTLIMVLNLSTLEANAKRALVINLPPDAIALSENYYNGQVVFDGQGNELGDVNDVVLDKKGQVVAVIVGVGGVLGAGEKNVGVPFDSLKIEEEDGKQRLVLDLKKAVLETAPGFDFDRGKRRWVPAAARTTDRQPDEQ